MDYFNSNFDNDKFDHQEDLPEGFGWDDMRDGIYDRMDTTKRERSNYRKYWPFLLLLFIGGCGTGGWMAMEFLNQQATKKSIATEKRTNQLNKEIQTKDLSSAISSELTDDSKSNTTVTQLPSNTLSNSNKPAITKKEVRISTSANAIKNQSLSSTAKKYEITDASVLSNTKTQQTVNKSIESKSTTVINDTDNNNGLFKEPVSVNTKRVQEKLNSIPSLSASLIEVATSYDLPTLEAVKKDNPKFKKHLVVSMAGGIVNWAAFDSKNINHDHVSGYPGYSFNPSVSLFLKPNHAIQVDYEYSALQELFDYEGSRDITISKEDEPVKHIINSLTGEVILTERQDLLVDGKRSYKEVKYNEYKLHTLSVGHRFAKQISNKSSLGLYSGLSFLMRLRSNGKRLDNNLDVINFDEDSPLFQGNQLGIRMGFFYDYKISKRTALFSQVLVTKYVTNWEVEGSTGATRPLLYGVQLGVRRSLGR